MFLKRTLPLLIVFTIGSLAFVHDFIPHPLSGEFRSEMASWMMIIGGFGMFLGVYSLMHMHITRIRQKMAGWGYSVFVFIGAVGMIATGVYGDIVGVSKDDIDLFDWGYKYIQVPCGATIFSILAFFVASAAFRTFRAKNMAAGLLLGAAVIVMFGRVPICEAVGGWVFNDRQAIVNVANAIMNYPNLAVKRGLLLGIGLAAIAQSVRVLFGVERTYLGGAD